MTSHVLTVKQVKGVELPEEWLVALQPLSLSDPLGMTVYLITSVLPKPIEGSRVVFSPRILNDSINNERGVPGYLLVLGKARDPNSLTSYTSIAKVWVKPLR